MRESFASRGGYVLAKTPSYRQRAARRRALAAVGFLALAMVSALIGAVNHPRDPTLGTPQTGPFSYFPSE